MEYLCCYIIHCMISKFFSQYHDCISDANRLNPISELFLQVANRMNRNDETRHDFDKLASIDVLPACQLATSVRLGQLNTYEVFTVYFLIPSYLNRKFFMII